MQNSNIQLNMHITQGYDVSKTSYEVGASFFKKNEQFFLLFDEENYDDHEITKCRFEIDKNTLRMRRNGPIIMEQTHVAGQTTDGYIKTPFGHISTKLATSSFLFTEAENGHYRLALNYDLYTGGEKTGTYALEIMITPKEAIVS